MRVLLKTLLGLLLLTSSTFAGIRGPGKYAGIVIFDRWDTCYLYSGTYLMYISEKKKELLRAYEGKSILIDAKEVFQPMNPGDGLITRFKIIGFAGTKKNLPDVRGLKLLVTPGFGDDRSPKFRLEIENIGKANVSFTTNEISPTLLGLKDSDDSMSPSDGKSHAAITRCTFEYARDWKQETEINGKTREFSIEIEGLDTIKPSYVLKPGEKTEFSIQLHISQGDYDFLFGYGGGVHDGKGLASNIVSFNIDSKGKASLLTTPTNRSTITSQFIESLYLRSDPSTLLSPNVEL